jgi:uncharacterized protein
LNIGGIHAEFERSGVPGSRAAHALADRRQLLNTIFAGLIIAVAIYMLVRSIG